MVGGDGSTPGGQVGPASELEVERFEASCGLEEERGSIVAVGRDDGNVASKERRLCALETVEWVRLRRGQKPQDRVEGPGLEARLRSSQRALRTPPGIHGQRNGALQERGRCCDSAARLSPASRVLELGRDLLARSRCRPGSVPGAPVRVRGGIGCFGEGAMDAVAILGGRRAVGGGADEWMRELDAPTYLEQTRVHGRVDRSHVDVERLGGTVEQQRVTERLCGRGEDEQLCSGGE